MADNHEPPAEGDAKPSENLPTPQRRIFGTRRLANEPAPPARPDLEEKLANLVDSVKVLQNHITTGAPLAEPPTDAEAKARRIKRFQRAGNEEPPEAPEAEAPLDHEIRGDEVTLNKNIAWPRLARLDAGPPSPAGGKPKLFSDKYKSAIWAVAYITGFGLLALGYWLGQSSGGTDENDPPSEPAAHATPAPDLLTRVGVNDRALEAANTALTAEKGGDVAAARTLYEAAVNGSVQLPGAEYRLAMLDVLRKDYTEADNHLSRSLAQGEMMAECYFVYAYFACHLQAADYPRAADQLAQAVRVEPFNAKYYFCWGEALRRAGKTGAAVDAITQALNRPAPPRDLELFNFKLRLTKIEGGHDDALAAELASRLAKGDADGDWLLLAAAQDLSKSAFPAAAEHLRAAQKVLSPALYVMRVRDYAFQGYAGQKEVADLLKDKPPEPSALPLDFGSWPAETADPAVWAPFAPMR